MIHLKKVSLLRPSILNLFRKAHFSPVRLHTPLENNCLSANTGFTEINSTDTFKTPKNDFVANLLLKYADTKPIPWDEVTKIVSDEPVKDKSERNQPPAVSSRILKTCIDLQLDTIGISYCKYLALEIRDVSLLNLFHIMKFLETFSEKAAEHKELLKVLLNEIKPYLVSNFNFASLFIKVLCNDYECWKDLVHSCSSLQDVSADILNTLASKAFEFNEFEMGLKIWNSNHLTIGDDSFVSYLNYCIREAEKGKFSVSLINNLVEKCQKSFSVFPETNILPLFRTLVSTLNSDPNKTHVWNVYETKVNNFNTCLNCNLRLDALKLTEEEFTKLRDHVLSNVIINTNVNIKTSNKELFNFLLYLKHKKYDVVLDGLNIALKQLHTGNSVKQGSTIINIINYFKKKNMKMLFIGRSFLKKYHFFNYIKENCEVFFAHSLTDDDVFLMYATLHGGINTHFFTADFLRGYHVLLKDEKMQLVFKKWNIIRRFSFLPNSLKIVEPKVHSCLPQQTKIDKSLREKGEMCWHIPVGCNSQKKIFGGNPVWYCLWKKSLDQNSSFAPSFTNQEKIDSVEENNI